MYEHKRQPLASKATYYARIRTNLLTSFLLMCICLAIGTIGFKMSASEKYDWYDCLHNAAMLLSGMGPVITDIPTAGGKIFSSAYALFSGIMFITNIGILMAPGVHRFFHRLHLEES